MISMLHTEFHGHTFLCARKEYNVLWADETSLKLKKQQRKKMEKKEIKRGMSSTSTELWVVSAMFKRALVFCWRTDHLPPVTSPDSLRKVSLELCVFWVVLAFPRSLTLSLSLFFLNVFCVLNMSIFSCRSLFYCLLSYFALEVGGGGRF